MSRQSSRVGSYDTFSSSRDAARAGRAASAAASTIVTMRMGTPFVSGRGPAAGGVASHSDLDTSVAKAGELLADTADGGVGHARPEAQLEPCSGTGPERVVRERLGGVRREQHDALDD